MMSKKIVLSFLIIAVFFPFILAQDEDFSEPLSSSETSEMLESSFTVPSSFNSVMDSLMFSYYAKHAKKGKCKKKGYENIEYSDSIIKLKLESLPNEIDMPYNNKVKTVINFYVDRRRDHVEKLLGLSKYYFPIFEDILAENDMPIEFKILPVIESALNTTVVSRAGARGLWQFMPSTGRMYGLTVNTLVDERCDPVKSTYAAVRYLKDLYRIYNDWHMAIAAYNCGPGTVNKAIRRSGGKRDYWSIYRFLPAETRSYVPIFIAANYVMQYYSDHNLCPAEIDMPIYTDTIVVNERLCFSKVAQVLGIPIDELRILNPQYRKDIIPGSKLKEYNLRLPTHYAAKFIDLKDSIFAPSCIDSMPIIPEPIDPPIVHTPKHIKVVHKVRRGDTLTGIASRYGVKVSDIKRWNGLRGSKIQIGQRLTIRR